MNEKDACALIERALGCASADHTELVLTGTDEGSTRFANNAITQNIAKTDVRLAIRSAFGNRVGTVRVNRFDDDALRAAVRRSEEIARMSEPDTEYLPPVGAQQYPAVHAYDEATARATPDDRAAVIKAGLNHVEGAGLNSAGSYATESSFVAVGNSAGMRAYHQATQARYICTAMTPDSSGWAESASWLVGRVDAGAAAQRAVQKALAARAPQAVEPRKYTVVMEPAAVAEILGFLAWSIDAKAADEGRSAFSGKLGQRIAGENITITSQPGHPECPGSPFFDDGMPVPAVTWVDRGIVANLAHTRFWAQKSGRTFTGRPTNLVVAGSDTPADALIASTDDGILITRFWYIRYVDPMKLLLTGMTRDGLYRIEGGKVTGGIKNMRFNESPLNMLANTVALGRPAYQGRGVLVPALKVEGFTFSSGTRF